MAEELDAEMERLTALITKRVPLCPLCGGPIPDADRPGAHPGARSRFDQTTEICSSCGQLEALLAMKGDPIPDPHPFKNVHNPLRLSKEMLAALKDEELVRRLGL